MVSGLSDATARRLQNENPGLGLEGSHTEPVVDPEVRDGVEEEDGGDVKDLSGLVQGSEGDGEAKVGNGNEDGLVGTENGTGGVEVADVEETAEGTNLTLLAALASGGVEEEVHLPSEELVADEVDKLEDRGVLEKLVKVDAAEQGLLGGLGLSGGNESHVLLHVAGEAVVTVVRELPGEVGNEEEGVEHPADAVVQLGVLGKGAVAALVTQDPDTGADESLKEAIDHPGGTADDGVLDPGDVGESSPDEGRDHGIVAEYIVEGRPQGGLKAVSRNGVSDGLDIRELRLR